MNSKGKAHLPPVPIIASPASKGPLPTFCDNAKNPWIFTEYQILYESPSVLQAKWEAKDEIWGRHEACMFIDKVCRTGLVQLTPEYAVPGLDLPNDLTQKAKALVHRLFMRRPQVKWRWEYCAALVFLASKLGKSRDFRPLDAVAFTSAKMLKKASLTDEDKNFWRKRTRAAEMSIMFLLFGDLNPELPHQFAMDIIARFQGSNELMASAVKCCNDAMITTLSLRVRPEVIGQAAVLLACFKIKQDLKYDGKLWWEAMHLDKSTLDAHAADISNARNHPKVIESVGKKKAMIAAQITGRLISKTSGIRSSKSAVPETVSKRTLPMTPSPTSPSKTPKDKNGNPPKYRRVELLEPHVKDFTKSSGKYTVIDSSRLANHGHKPVGRATLSSPSQRKIDTRPGPRPVPLPPVPATQSKYAQVLPQIVAEPSNRPQRQNGIKQLVSSHRHNPIERPRTVSPRSKPDLRPAPDLSPASASVSKRDTARHHLPPVPPPPPSRPPAPTQRDITRTERGYVTNDLRHNPMRRPG
ncbi:hypothetical protein HDU87_008849 [Geranomyces variabilis]|uniref:Uncharacterized protein n=1 Tax=Geranomyces variabilis TaxID=109894 RepID=A0AAD5THU4_9FUNG|nr:hypothetical protein HDU87_008849 [Geranomyces variabilis]